MTKGVRVDWFEEVQIVETRVLPPDPRLMDAIGLNHAFESAIADLVDNSIDAGARNVLVRFVRDGERLIGLYTVDDGKGMDDITIDTAMTVGGRRDYSSGDLGHFGLGLKAASLGQAESLTVMSRSDGHPACGRRWQAAKAASGFECEVLGTEFATETMDSLPAELSGTTGTIVRWDDVRAFPKSNRADTTNRFVEDTFVKLRLHLGLVFHRFLSSSRVVIRIDVEDLAVEEGGAVQQVEAVDPFGYVRSGLADFPKHLTFQVGAASARMSCHIWSPRSELPGFKLHKGTPLTTQGFYFYRNDRLLQAGGWNGVVHPERRLQLARICVEIDDSLAAHLKMNPEKTNVRADEAFVRGVESAGSDGITLSSYLDDAARLFQSAQKRTRTRDRVIPPGRGFAPPVRKAIAAELDFVPGEEPIAVRWADFHDDSFFDIDRDEHVIWLNKSYRWAVVGEGDSSLNDAPLVKTMLYLLLEQLFRGSYLGAKDKDNIALWGTVLAAAARAETS